MQPGGGEPRSRKARRSPGRTLQRRLLWFLGAALLLAGSLDLPSLGEAWHRARPYLFGGALLTAVWHPLSAVVRGHGSQGHALACAAALGAAVAGDAGGGTLALLLFSLQEALVFRFFQWTSRPLDRVLQKARALEAGTSGEGNGPGGGRRVPGPGLIPGVLYVVRPGEVIPADGVVVDGLSEVDESLLAGEGTLSSKGPSDFVLAGSVNRGASLCIEVSARPEESVLPMAARRLEKALSEKLPVQDRVERAARGYTLLVMLAGVAVAAVPPLLLDASVQPWLARGVLLFLLASPAPFVLSVPAAILPALSGAARKGVYFRGPGVLDALAGVDGVVFDATGTLTRGRFVVVEVVPFGPFDPGRLLALAAGMERAYDDPIARAVGSEARRAGCAPEAMDSVRRIPGLGFEAAKGGRLYHLGGLRAMRAFGVQVGLAENYAARLHAEGKEALILAEDGRAIGVIALEDRVKAESDRLLGQLKAAGLRIHMVTGCPQGKAAYLARLLDIDACLAERLPEEKAGAVAGWRAAGARLAAVGSGVGDVAALTSADAGIALGAGRSRELFEAADAAVVVNDLEKLSYLFALARRTRGAVRSNLVWAVLGRGAALLLAVLGELTLAQAALIELGLSLVSTANGSRLALRLRLRSERHRGRERDGE